MKRVPFWRYRSEDNTIYDFYVGKAKSSDLTNWPQETLVQAGNPDGRLTTHRATYLTLPDRTRIVVTVASDGRYIIRGIQTWPAKDDPVSDYCLLGPTRLGTKVYSLIVRGDHALLVAGDRILFRINVEKAEQMQDAIRLYVTHINLKLALQARQRALSKLEGVVEQFEPPIAYERSGGPKPRGDAYLCNVCYGFADTEMNGIGYCKTHAPKVTKTEAISSQFKKQGMCS